MLLKTSDGAQVVAQQRQAVLGGGNPIGSTSKSGSAHAGTRANVDPMEELDLLLREQNRRKQG